MKWRESVRGRQEYREEQRRDQLSAPYTTPIKSYQNLLSSIACLLIKCDHLHAQKRREERNIVCWRQRKKREKKVGGGAFDRDGRATRLVCSTTRHVTLILRYTFTLPLGPLLLLTRCLPSG